MTEKNINTLDEDTAEQNKATIKAKAKPDSISDIEKTPEEVSKVIVAAAHATSKAPKRPADNVNENSILDKLSSICEESGIDKEFVVKITALVEAAIAEKIASLESLVEEELKNHKEKNENETKEKMNEELSKINENINNYIENLSEKYLTENKLSIENGLKLELAESLFTGISNLFVEHNIELPEKIEAVKTLEEKIATISDDLNNSLNENISLKKQIEKYEATNIINSVCEGLTVSQSEKIKTLAESITYASITELKTKLDTVKESVIVPTSTIKRPTTEFLSESIQEDNNENISSEMKAYLDAIKRINVLR